MRNRRKGWRLNQDIGPHMRGLGEAVVGHISAIWDRLLQRLLGLCPVSGARDGGRGVVVGDPQASAPGTLYWMTPVLWSLAPESQLPRLRSWQS